MPTPIAKNPLEVRPAINRKANQITKACDQYLIKQDNPFLLDISTYLYNRQYKYMMNLFNEEKELQARTDFIGKLATAVMRDDIGAQEKLLEEKNIRRFKGFFTHRLYDMLVKHRQTLPCFQPTVQLQRVS